MNRLYHLSAIHFSLGRDFPMDMQAVLKAGGLGAAVLIVLNLLGLIPCVGCITFILSLVVYVAIGVMAARWMVMPLTGSSGALNGAVAALVAALVAGFINAIIQSIYFSITGSAQFTQALADLPPEQLAAMQEMGLDPAMFAAGGGLAAVIGFGLLCCGLFAVLAAGLGAAGGGYWGSSHAS
jgi:hypothetical protein